MSFGGAAERAAERRAAWYALGSRLGTEVDTSDHLWIDFADAIGDIAIGLEYPHTFSRLADFPQTCSVHGLHTVRAVYGVCVDCPPASSARHSAVSGALEQ